jgi:hypothetical protein
VRYRALGRLHEKACTDAWRAIMIPWLIALGCS